MAFRALLLGSLFVFVLLGCGQNIRTKQLGEPCTRKDQCESGLVCLAGVCQFEEDAGADGGS